MKIRAALFLLLAGALLASTASAQNLLLNPGFETRVQSAGSAGNVIVDGPWLMWFPTTFSSIYYENYKLAFAGLECGPPEVFAGLESAWVATTPGTDGVKGRAGAWQLVNVTPNTDYSVSAWVHTYKPQAGSLGFGNDPTDYAALELVVGSAYIVLDQVTSLVPWTRLSGTFHTDSATTSLYVLLDTQMNEGAFEGGVSWDNASFEVVPEPASIVALFGALLGMPLAFRKRK